MDTLKDLIFRYCVLFGRRFYAKEKLTFLRVIGKELMQLGYRVDAKIAKLQLAKKRYENYYNAYIGDVDRADLIVCTYYDTGVNNFNLSKTYAFEQQFGRKRYLIGLLPIIILAIASVILNYLLFIPGIQEMGLVSVSGALSAITTLLLFYFILKFKNGIPNKKNFVCNTSSILVMLNIIKKLDKNAKKKIAFVLCDGGRTSQYGLRMLESYSSKITKKNIVFLDSIGNSDKLVFFKSGQLPGDFDNITLHDGKLDTSFENYLMVTSGELDADNKVMIKNANSRKDNALSLQIIEQHTESLYDLFISLIAKK